MRERERERDRERERQQRGRDRDGQRRQRQRQRDTHIYKKGERIREEHTSRGEVNNDALQANELTV